MKKHLSIILILIACGLQAQTKNSEIFIFDMEFKDGELKLDNKKNITNNPGYDNQPSFYNDYTLVYSSDRDGQNDIKQYQISTGRSRWLTNTKIGSEYSPQRVYGSADISAVRLDTSGLQQLYRYDFATFKPKAVIKSAKVGYYFWYDVNTIISTQLNQGRMDLVISHLNAGLNLILQENVDRSVLKVPNANEISFVSTGSEMNQIWTLDPIENVQKGVSRIKKARDFAWLPDGTLLAAYDNRIEAYNDEESSEWKVMYEFDDADLQNLSRLAVNPSNNILAVVSEVPDDYSATDDRVTADENSTNELINEVVEEEVEDTKKKRKKRRKKRRKELEEEEDKLVETVENEKKKRRKERKKLKKELKEMEDELDAKKGKKKKKKKKKRRNRKTLEELDSEKIEEDVEEIEEELDSEKAKRKKRKKRRKDRD